MTELQEQQQQCSDPPALDLHIRDSGITLSPIVPEDLLKKLRYWHKKFTKDPQGYTMKVGGSTVRLYTLTDKPSLQDGGLVSVQEMHTLPGFTAKVVHKLHELGYRVNIIDQRTPAPEPDIIKACKGLREYQYEAAYAALNSRGGIVSCPTGWGKTHLMGAIIRGYSPEAMALRGTPQTLVVTPTLDISDKNYHDLVDILPEREIGIVNTNYKRFSDDVQVVTPESLDHVDMSDVGLLIYDEVHTVSMGRMTRLIQADRAVRYGMSATPTGRFDGGDKIIEGLFGPVVYTKTYREAVQDGAVVPIKVYWVTCPQPPGYTGGYNSKNACYRHVIWRNSGMHEIVAGLMRRAADDYQVLAVVDKIEHMNFMLPHMPDDVVPVHAETVAKKCTGLRRGNIEPISKKKRREIYEKVASGELTRVLSTGIYRTGVDFPNLRVLINCEGMGSQIIAGQLPGRASRSRDGKDVGYIVDFWHPWDMVEDNGRSKPGMILRDDRARERVYTDLGFEQEWIDDPETLTFE